MKKTKFLTYINQLIKIFLKLLKNYKSLLKLQRNLILDVKHILYVSDTFNPFSFKCCILAHSQVDVISYLVLVLFE